MAGHGGRVLGPEPTRLVEVPRFVRYTRHLGELLRRRGGRRCGSTSRSRARLGYCPSLSADSQLVVSPRKFLEFAGLSHRKVRRGPDPCKGQSLVSNLLCAINLWLLGQGVIQRTERRNGGAC